MPRQCHSLGAASRVSHRPGGESCVCGARSLLDGNCPMLARLSETPAKRINLKEATAAYPCSSRARHQTADSFWIARKAGDWLRADGWPKRGSLQTRGPSVGSQASTIVPTKSKGALHRTSKNTSTVAAAPQHLTRRAALTFASRRRRENDDPGSL